MSNSLVIINTGCANIASVKFAFERIGAKVEVSDKTDVISAAQKVILPGVGSAPAAMKSINAKNLTHCIQALSQPVLGVCLGMQLMATLSMEGEYGSEEPIECLDVIPGSVQRMKVGELRLPHMGWNKVNSVQPNPLFDGIPNGEFFYFVHSFAIEEYENTLATCEYSGPFSAAIHLKNFFGVQFHPERSSDAGSHLLENFLKL